VIYVAAITVLASSVAVVPQFYGVVELNGKKVPIVIYTGANLVFDVATSEVIQHTYPFAH
jgi:hypothetical protein